MKIWSLEPQDGGVATFELLATLAFHQQAVNCVRWAAHGRYAPCLCCVLLPLSCFGAQQAGVFTMVHWSVALRYLASGSDDQLVLLYELQSGAPAPVPFGSNAKPNTQNWVRCSTLKRHTMGTYAHVGGSSRRGVSECSIQD